MSNQTDDEITFMDGNLYNAIYEGNINILEEYSEAGFQLQRTPTNNNILHLAAQFGQLECLRWILDSSSSSSLLLEPNLRGEIPLHLAAREGHLEVVKALIAAAKKSPHHGMESGVEAYKEMLRKTNNEEETALHEAVRYHHSEVVETLIREDPALEYGANINGCTPLYLAAKRGYGDLVDMIIDSTRTSPSYTGDSGRTALHAAVISRDEEMTAKLLEWKPDLIKKVDENGWSPLHCAAYLNYYEIVVELLKESSDKSVVYLGIKDGKKTALHIAASRGNRETVKVILYYCPDCCEQVDDEGNNVLHFAAMANEMEVVSTILTDSSWLRVRGVVNKKNAREDTPLHLLASGKRYYPDLPFFQDDSVDKMAVNNDNLTPGDILLRSNVQIDLELYAKRWKKIYKIINSFTTKEPMGSNEDLKAHVIMKNEDEEKEIPEWKRVGESNLIVAALIATVTFAAGFTLPGGYNQDDGMAMLSRKAAFKAFIVTDAIAVMLSLSAVFVYFFLAFYDDKDFILNHVLYGFCLTTSAMVAMMAAFMTGLYAVLPLSSGLPVVTCIICCFFLVAFYFGFRQCYKNIKKE